MPACIPRRASVLAWVVLAVVVLAYASLGYLCYRCCPALLVMISIFLVLSWGIDKWRQQRLAAQRRSENICTFARSFNCRSTDTWIIRAVFDELSLYVTFPIRGSDRFEEDLKLDALDLVEIAQVVAQRTGRPLEQCEQNPLYDKVRTVRDLVDFFRHQPRQPAAS